MTDFTPILPRLAKLMPRLASDADGEVVATVRAIDRTLRSAGADWHDLTSALAPPLPPPGPVTRPKPRPWRPETWREVANWCAQRALSEPGTLATKELAFVCDMARKLGRFRQPSEKQAAWLRSIYDKLGGPQ